MITDEILVSVIIPTHNRFKTLFRAIDSIINQTHKRLQIIVVDDNYENGSLRALINERIDSIDDRIMYITPNRKLGMANAENIGIENADGDYIAFLDDDDVYYPEKIEKQLKFLIDSDDERLGLVYCFGKIIYPNESFEYEKTDITGIHLAEHMMNNVAGTSFWLCRKSALINVGMFELIGAHNDGVVILKLMATGYKVDLVKECLVDYYVHKASEGITAINYNTLKADVDYLQICQRYFYLLTKTEQRKVINHYYDDRNWNLIIIGDYQLCIDDFWEMRKRKISVVTQIKCFIRYVFKHYIRHKEGKRIKKRGLQ